MRTSYAASELQRFTSAIQGLNPEGLAAEDWAELRQMKLGQRNDSRGGRLTADHAKTAGDLVPYTRALGLSPGDRACLALGLVLKAPVYTTDRSWKNLSIGVRIHVIQ
jgi:PIN domain nuclease of toxin-antitoxin system